MASAVAETSETSEHHDPGQTFLIRELIWHPESDGVHLYPSRFWHLKFSSTTSECSFVALFCPYNQPYELCLYAFLSCAVVVPSDASPGQNIYMVAPDGSGRYCFVTVPGGYLPGSSFLMQMPAMPKKSKRKMTIPRRFLRLPTLPTSTTTSVIPPSFPPISSTPLGLDGTSFRQGGGVARILREI